MYVVIGENDYDLTSVGTGSTLEQAVVNWSKISSVDDDKEKAYEAFKKWAPTVVQGAVLKVEVREKTSYEFISNE